MPPPTPPSWTIADVCAVTLQHGASSSRVIRDMSRWFKHLWLLRVPCACTVMEVCDGAPHGAAAALLLRPSVCKMCKPTSCHLRGTGPWQKTVYVRMRTPSLNCHLRRAEDSKFTAASKSPEHVTSSRCAKPTARSLSCTIRCDVSRRVDWSQRHKSLAGPTSSVSTFQPGGLCTTSKLGHSKTACGTTYSSVLQCGMHGSITRSPRETERTRLEVRK